MAEAPREQCANEESSQKSALAERRKFLKKAGKAAVTAPAVALLLSVGGQSAEAVPPAPSGLTTDFAAGR